MNSVLQIELNEQETVVRGADGEAIGVLALLGTSDVPVAVRIAVGFLGLSCLSNQAAAAVRDQGQLMDLCSGRSVEAALAVRNALDLRTGCLAPYLRTPTQPRYEPLLTEHGWWQLTGSAKSISPC